MDKASFKVYKFDIRCFMNLKFSMDFFDYLVSKIRN